MLHFPSLSPFRTSKNCIFCLWCIYSLCWPSYASIVIQYHKCMPLFVPAYVYVCTKLYVWVSFVMFQNEIRMCVGCVLIICICIYIYIYIYMHIYGHRPVCVHIFLWACYAKVRGLSFLLLRNWELILFHLLLHQLDKLKLSGLLGRNGFCNLIL
jgi:hypothetical protein